jgi:hypothetical protein
MVSADHMPSTRRSPLREWHGRGVGSVAVSRALSNFVEKAFIKIRYLDRSRRPE